MLSSTSWSCRHPPDAPQKRPRRGSRRGADHLAGQRAVVALLLLFGARGWSAETFGTTTLFVLGFTAVFVALGAGATQVSRFLLSNQSLTGRIAGIIVILFAIIMIGSAFTSRGIFGFFSRERRVEVRPSRLGSWAPPVMGAAFGFGWSACIGPILAWVLAIAATQDTVVRGIMLLFVFLMGLGVPFVLAGLTTRAKGETVEAP